MRNLLYLIIFAIAASFAPSLQAQDADSLWAQRMVQQLETQNQQLQQTVSHLSRQMDYLSRRLYSIEKAQSDSAAQMAKKVDDVRSDLDGATSGFNSRLSDIDTKVDAGDAASQQKSHRVLLLAIVGFVALIVVIVMFYIAFHKSVRKGNDTMSHLADESQRLQVQQVALDNKLTSLLEKQLADAGKAAESAGPDHSLILTIANEMARIDQNLRFMDPKTKGVNQLRNRSKAISDALKKKGYDIPTLIGTEYKEGYNMEASFEEDYDLEPGKMIIIRVTRPAVLYNGKLIQAPEVVVAHNPE